MEAQGTKGISKDAQRHVSTFVHHNERAKDERLERQDGTGRGHEGLKKGGAGRGNWGGPLEGADIPAGEVVEGGEDEGPEAVSPRDFVENKDVLTLDEYEERKAAQKA